MQLQLLGIALHTMYTCLHFALRRAAARHLSSTGSWNDTFHLLVPPYSSTGSWNDRYCTPRFHSLACAEVRSCNFGSSVNPRLPSTPLSPSSSSQFLMCIFNLCIFNLRETSDVYSQCLYCGKSKIKIASLQPFRWLLHCQVQVQQTPQ